MNRWRCNTHRPFAREALPPRHRYYGLMCQSCCLPSTMHGDSSMDLCSLDHPLLVTGPSRRYLCESFSGCMDPYPGSLRGAFARFFPQSIGLPPVMIGRQLSAIPSSDFSSGRHFGAAVIP